MAFQQVKEISLANYRILCLITSIFFFWVNWIRFLVHYKHYENQDFGYGNKMKWVTIMLSNSWIPCKSKEKKAMRRPKQKILSDVVHICFTLKNYVLFHRPNHYLLPPFYFSKKCSFKNYLCVYIYIYSLRPSYANGSYDKDKEQLGIFFSNSRSNSPFFSKKKTNISA